MLLTMLRIDRKTRKLQSLIAKTLPESGLTERGDLQSMIRNSPDAFFAEMGENLLLLGEEVRPTEWVDDRIDLLALDPQGAVTVIELKRGSHKLHLLQALGYAATVSKWDRNSLLKLRAQLTSRQVEDAEEDLDEFLVDSSGSLNQSQRIVLVAENFDYMVLATAEWLTEKFDVDIKCFRVKLSTDGIQEFLSCTCIYPPPELVQSADGRVRRKDGTKGSRWTSWDEVFSNVSNTAIVDFFKHEINAGREHYLRNRQLHFRIGEHRRLFLAARRELAYGWQHRRFDGDLEFWRERLSMPDKVQEVKNGRCLRFFLSTADDFRKLREATDGPLKSKVFFAPNGDGDAEEETEGEDGEG